MPRARRSHRDETTRHLDIHPDDDSPEIRFEEYLLRRAAWAVAGSENQMTEAISLALSSGLSWNRIGHLLGVSAEEAHAKYGRMVRRAS
jgi:hypothetical protein